MTFVGHKFRINSIPFLKDTAARINIKKRKEKINYKSLSTEDNINIAYLAGSPVNPTNNLFVSDKSTSLTQNRILNIQNPIVSTTKTLTLNTSKFLVTDQFTVEKPTRPEVPLFFTHRLLEYNGDLLNFSNLSLLSIQFTNYALTPIEINDYYLDSEGLLYNNIENSFNAQTQSIDVSFVRYAVRDNVTLQVSIYHELISNVPAFTLAGFDDISSGEIKPGRKKYIIEEQPGQFFLVTLPVVAKYAYKETPVSKIKILMPTAQDLSSPWNVRITNGEFISSLKVTDVAFLNHKYYLPEFSAQTFSPFPPYKVQTDQDALWLYDNLVKVPKNIAFNSELNLHVTMTVRSSSNTLKAIYTTDQNKVGTLFEDSVRYTLGILSIDSLNGFIETKNKVRSDDNIKVTYYTEEKEYEFTPIDLNPVNNLNILNRRIVLYINPETSATGALTRSIYYLVVDSLGRITYSSQADESSINPATQKMIAEDFFDTGEPRYDIYYDRESTESGLNVRASGVNLSYRSEFSFVDKYTVDSVLLTSSTFSGIAVDQNFSENSRYLILGDIYVGENTSAKGLSNFDIRISGGGIKESKVEEALGENPEVSWFWNLDSKKSYPGVGAFFTEIPQSILSDHGGSFSLEEVGAIVERHMKAGGYSILRKYGINPMITESIPSSGEINISWPTYGPDTTYNIYYSKDMETGFALSNNAPLVDSSSGNDFTISGLNSSTKYFLKVGALDINDDESFGVTISTTTT